MRLPSLSTYVSQNYILAKIPFSTIGLEWARNSSVEQLKYVCSYSEFVSKINFFRFFSWRSLAGIWKNTAPQFLLTRLWSCVSTKISVLPPSKTRISLLNCCFLFRQKQGSSVTDSVLVQVPNGLSLEFERTDSTRRLRLVLYEVLMIQSQVGYIEIYHF